MSFSKGVLFAGTLEIQILDYFNRIGPWPTLETIQNAAMQPAIADIGASPQHF